MQILMEIQWLCKYTGWHLADSVLWSWQGQAEAAGQTVCSKAEMGWWSLQTAPHIQCIPAFKARYEYANRLGLSCLFAVLWQG